MNYNSQKELYLALLPVLKVKERINNYYGYHISKETMWNYLGRSKWRNAKNLSLAEIVNDIIVLDIIKMKGQLITNE